jgi:hypothetical protein
MENSLSEAARALIWAHEKGYKCINNRLFSHLREIKLMTTSDGYYFFSVRPTWAINRKQYKIKVHRLVAYEKFGKEIFNPNLVTRHLDGNPKNNHPDNLALGTQSQNMMDKKPEARLAHSLNATVKNRKFTDLEINLIREDSKIHKLSYPKIMKKWNISSKGTLSYIINHSYQTKI